MEIPIIPLASIRTICVRHKHIQQFNHVFSGDFLHFSAQLKDTDHSNQQFGEHFFSAMQYTMFVAAFIHIHTFAYLDY